MGDCDICIPLVFVRFFNICFVFFIIDFLIIVIILIVATIVTIFISIFIISITNLNKVGGLVLKFLEPIIMEHILV